MSRSASVFARVEPEVKSEAEAALADLGIPMSNAVGMFLRQVVLCRGIPFEVKLPSVGPSDLSQLSEDEFDQAISLGWDEVRTKKVLSDRQVRERLSSLESQ